MRLALAMISLMALSACNSVKFSPATAESGPLSQVTPQEPACQEGHSIWVPGGQGVSACSNPCSDGSYLQCEAELEKEKVCVAGAYLDTGAQRVIAVGDAIGTCPLPPTTKTVSENFNAPGTGKADILVVLDTTSSMSPDLNKLSRRFASLTSQLGNVDWQVAVTNAGVSGGWFWDSWDLNGKFMTFQNHPQKKKILNSKDRNVDDYFRWTVGRDGESGCEQQPYCMWPDPEPLNVIRHAIDRRNSDNQGFFRDGAYLVPLVISDADEDENGDGFTPTQLINYFNQTLSSRMKGMIGFGIIIKPGDKECLSRNRSLFRDGWGGAYGTFVDQFARLTSGLTLSLCSDDFGPGLAQISEKVREKIDVVDLKNEPLGGDVEVIVTPSVSGLTWKVKNKRLSFSRPLPPNAKIEVRYRVPAK